MNTNKLKEDAEFDLTNIVYETETKDSACSPGDCNPVMFCADDE